MIKLDEKEPSIDSKDKKDKLEKMRQLDDVLNEEINEEQLDKEIEKYLRYVSDEDADPKDNGKYKYEIPQNILEDQ